MDGGYYTGVHARSRSLGNERYGAEPRTEYMHAQPARRQSRRTAAKQQERQAKKVEERRKEEEAKKTVNCHSRCSLSHIKTFANRARMLGKITSKRSNTP